MAQLSQSLDIVIVSWNTVNLLRSCLESVRRETEQLSGFETQVTVVDNCSSDGSVRMLEREFDWVRIEINRENVGFARANNQVIRNSNAGLLLLLNPDTELREGALAKLIKGLEAAPEAGAAGARLISSEGVLEVSCYPLPSLSRELWRLFYFDKLFPYSLYPMNRWGLTEPKAVESMMGACLLVKRAVLDQVGFLDEDYWIYSEDIDLCHRIISAGWKLLWIPDSVVLHFGGRSTNQVSANMFLELYRSKLLYFRKHYGRSGAYGYKVILFLASVSRLLLSHFSLPFSKRRQQLRSVITNYWRLIRSLPSF